MTNDACNYYSLRGNERQDIDAPEPAANVISVSRLSMCVRESPFSVFSVSGSGEVVVDTRSASMRGLEFLEQYSCIPYDLGMGHTRVASTSS